MSLNFVWTNIVNYGLPFAAFFFGIFIASKLKLVGGFKPSHVALMGIPVSLILIPMLLFSAEPAYQQSVLKFLFLSGTICFYGTVTPQLFASIRDEILKKARSNPNLFSSSGGT